MVRISSDSAANAVIIGIGVSFDILMESLTHTFLSSVIRFHLQVDDLFVTLELARCGVLPRVGSSDCLILEERDHHWANRHSKPDPARREAY